MKLLHWYPNFLGGGGVANAVLGLVQAQTDNGAEVAIASAEAEGPPLYQHMEGALGKVRLFRWDPRWRVRVGGLQLRGLPKNVVNELRSFHPDVVHIHGEFNPDNLWVPRIFRGKTLILSPHGAFHPVVLNKSKKLGKSLYISCARRLLYRYVRAFHALNPAEAEHIQKKIADCKVYTVPQGGNRFVLESLDDISDSADRALIRYIFVGRLDIYTKGLDILLEAFAAAVRAWGDRPAGLHLILVGPDWRGSRRRLEDQAERLGLTRHVTFTGSLAGSAVAGYIAGSDIYVHLSRHENQSLSVAEALSAGKPCILSREIGSVSWPEVRTLPHVKVIAPSKDEASRALVEFAEQVSELKRVGENMRGRICDFFDWKRVAKEHIDAYERLG